MQSGSCLREEVLATAFVVEVSHSERALLRTIGWIVPGCERHGLTHVPSVRSRAVHRFGSELPIPTKDLRHYGVLRPSEVYKQ
jgi:hypothetical protein